MKICQYDRVILKNGNEAMIVEILEEDKSFIADIDRNGDTDTEVISIGDIVDIISNDEVNEYEAAEIITTMMVTEDVLNTQLLNDNLILVIRDRSDLARERGLKVLSEELDLYIWEANDGEN